MKDWINYRIEELEEKANVVTYPLFDMDGTYFHPEEDDWNTKERDDAYEYSMSKRMGKMLGIY